MATQETYDVRVQLATRIPRSVHRAVKLHCVRTDTTLMAFVTAALREMLDRDTREATR